MQQCNSTGNCKRCVSQHTLMCSRRCRLARAEWGASVRRCSMPTRALRWSASWMSWRAPRRRWPPSKWMNTFVTRAERNAHTCTAPFVLLTRVRLHGMRALCCHCPRRCPLGRFHCGYATSLAQAIAKSPGISGVWITAPTPSHEALIAEAAALGLPVFTEKVGCRLCLAIVCAMVIVCNGRA